LNSPRDSVTTDIEHTRSEIPIVYANTWAGQISSLYGDYFSTIIQRAMETIPEGKPFGETGCGVELLE
jgi:hypothetical protein